MNEWVEDFKTYLPKYLSTAAQEDLFAELGQFPTNIDKRLYTTRLRDEANIFQGDGLVGLWVTDLPNERISKARVMVLSNTCDLSPDNKRLHGPRILYCPLIRFDKYAGMLEQGGRELPGFNRHGHLEAIRKQRNSSTFFLPKNDRLGDDAIALLDRVNNCDAQALDLGDLVRNRLFTLSNYGFYLFLFKLSLHLTRIREGVSRN